MKKITSKKAYDTALVDVYKLMQKGEKNITNKEANAIAALASAIQDYEKIHHPFPMPQNY
ncbi:MAG: hypothetical protein WDM90_01550 [Ferruginibacter sp.]